MTLFFKHRYKIADPECSVLPVAGTQIQVNPMVVGKRPADEERVSQNIVR